MGPPESRVFPSKRHDESSEISVCHQLIDLVCNASSETKCTSEIIMRSSVIIAGKEREFRNDESKLDIGPFPDCDNYNWLHSLPSS